MVAERALTKRPEARPRCDLDAESSVLGAVLLDPAVLAELRAVVQPEAFYSPAHAAIFRAMLSVADRGEPVDVVTVCAELARAGRINAVGGMQFVGSLTDATPTTAHAAAHARLIAEHGRARAVSLALREQLAAIERGESIDAVRSGLASTLDLCVSSATRGPKSYAELAGQWLTQTEEAMHSGVIPGVSTGWRAVDEMLGGLRGGQMIVIGARPRMGKTACSIAIAEHAASTHGPVLKVSLEMQALELFGRSAGGRGRVDGSRLRLGRISEDDLADLYVACEALRKLPIEVEDTPGLTLLDLAVSAARIKAKYGKLALIEIDYLQLLQSSSKSEGTREQEVGEISRGLKRLAKRLDVPIVVLAQLNRACDIRTEHRPQLSDLRDSGAIEQDADAVVFLYRDEVYDKDSADKGIAEFIIAKQRNGPEGTVRLAWEGKWMRFADLEPVRDAEDEWNEGGGA